ncbi:transposase [Methylomonas sp. MO1]|uniref:transposase n=1 Tax=unclassified Methylomonas TaxID=2608980 RepID=UPI0004789226|nr:MULTISPECIES: transposase [unclassified Methylomonas]MDT4290632.1 transposase [Methylomonas sp. MO1]
MKAENKSKIPVVRNKYTAQFKEQALERADKDGIPKKAKDLGLAESMLYNWRAKSRQTGQPFEDQRYSKPKWRGLNEKTPDWKRKSPF